MRGQLGVEFFLVASLFAVLLLWSINFAGTLQQNSGKASVKTQERQLAVDLVRVACSAYAHNSNLTFLLPCVSRGSSEAVNISAFNSSSLNVSSESGWVVENSPCVVNASFFSACSAGNGGYACAWPRGAFAQIDFGACS